MQRIQLDKSPEIDFSTFTDRRKDSSVDGINQQLKAPKKRYQLKRLKVIELEYFDNGAESDSISVQQKSSDRVSSTNLEQSDTQPYVTDAEKLPVEEQS